MKILLINFLLVLSSVAMAKTTPHNFWVSFVGESKSINKLQAKTELDILKNYKGCRGTFIASRSKKWSCRKKRSGELCSTEFRCDYVNKKRNILTQSRYIRRRISKSSGQIYKVKLLVSPDKPDHLNNLKTANKIYKRLYVSAPIDPKILEDIKESKVRADEAISRAQDEINLKEQTPEGLDESELAELVAKSEVEDLTITEAEEAPSAQELEDEISSLRGDEKWKVNERKKTDKGEDLYVVTPGEKEKKEVEEKEVEELTPFSRELEISSFSMAYLSLKDSLENSQATFNFAWNPYVWFSRSWGISANIGFHMLAYNETQSSIGEIESFNVIEGSAFLNYRVKSYFLEAGLGLERWGDSLGGSFLTSQFGFGKSFKEYKFYKLDKVFFRYVALGNEQKSTQMRLGLSFTF